ncbi:MAG: peptidoglycan-binding protein LysM [Methylocystis sp.]|uniref:peptidoglycan-binding protein LysM n=1 Tax=Methylocystis sp. TaxID=1911079 RepID=UPI003DA36BE5
MGLFDFLTGKRKSAPAPAPAGDTAPSPEELRQEIAKHGLDDSKIDLQINGGKVTLGGAAPTTADIEKLISAVRKVRGVAQVENRLVAVRAQDASQFYIVQRGDTLWKIAEKEYGHGRGERYKEIFEANQPLLKDPDKIYPGQNLRIPKLLPDDAPAAIKWKPPQEIAKPEE